VKVCFVVVFGASVSSVGRQKGLCESCLIRVSPACMTSSQYVCLRMT
jgi:hypothetical protein